MTLPAAPFVCESIDLEAAVDVLEKLAELPVGVGFKFAAEQAIAAALGETIPAEVEDRWFDVDAVALGYPDPEALIKTRKERFTTDWQPVIGDSV